jgi:LysR family transcriptional activator of nhaA
MELKELDDLNLNHLFYFHAVATHGSITAASRALHVAPSTLSEQIRELECTLGSPLFIRSSRSLSLNDAGRIVYEQTGVMMQAAERVVQQFIADSRRSVTALRVGCASSIARSQIAWDLTPLFALAGMRINIQTADSTQLVQALARGEVDLVISDHPAPDNLRGSLSTQELPSSPLVAVAAQVAVDKFGKDVLRELPLLQHSVSSRFRWDVEQWLRRRELSPRLLGEVDDVGVLVAVARTGTCFAVIPQASLMDAGLGLHVVETLDVACTRYAIHQGGTATEVVDRAVNLLRGGTRPSLVPESE